MSKVITTRIDDTMAKRLKNAAEKAHADKATFLRRLIIKGLNEVEKHDALEQYRSSTISIGKLSEMLHITKWDALDLLKENNIVSNYSMKELEEDML